MNVIRSRDIWGIFWLLAVSCPRRSIVDSLSLCDDWKYLEVIEKSDDNTFTCTGLTAQQDVVWSWSGSRMATCPPPPASCTVRDPAFNTFFRFSRTSTTASDITVLATAAPSLDYIGTNILTCESTVQESVTCLLDSVYPAENIVCKIQFNGDTWEVSGSCLISKVRSTRNKYGCYLYQTQGSQDSVRVGSFSMSTEASTPSGYFSGTCNMTSYLPPDGRYSYTVLIMPGEVNVSAVFYGNNEIRRPKSIPVHNCPLYVKEDNSVSCVCSVDDLGSPPGQLKWNNTSSEQLVLPGVKMDQHGVNYVCSLTWNRTVMQSVTYTLLVAYPPTQMSFKLNGKSENVVVTEKSPVTMLCQSDGRPTPNMTITDVTNGNRVVHSQAGGNVTLADQRVETRYDKATVECKDTGEYRCSADNIIGSKYQTVTLFVMCAPRRNPADANYTIPTVEEGKSVTMELIAYPTSVNVTKYFLGPNISSNEEPAKEAIFLVGCNASPPPSYKVICRITVTNVTSDTAGFYKVIVINQAGNVAFAFHALPRNITAPVTHSPDTWKYQCEINENVTDILWILQSTNETETLSRCSVESESCDQRLEDLARATINSTSSFLYISDSFVGQKDGRVGYAEIINGLRGEIRFDARTNPMNRANGPLTETTEQTDLFTDSPAGTDSLAAWQYQCQIRENVTDVLWILQVGNETETLSRCYIGSESCDQRLDDCAIATINITSSLFNISANLEKEKAGRVGYAEIMNGLNGEIRFDAKRNPIKWPCGPLTVTTGIFPSTKQTSESTDYSTGRTSP